MILDKDGKEIQEPAIPHKFGQFIVPDNCYIKGIATIDVTGKAPRSWGASDTAKNSQTRD